MLNGCLAVSQLSLLPSVACALADAGSVWPLTAALQRCSTPLVIKHAAGALRNLCSSSDAAREQFLPSGGLQAAARLLVEGRSLGRQLLTNVAGLLWCSCKHGPNMENALRLAAFDGIVHAAGRALSVIASACMKQVVGVGTTQQPATRYVMQLVAKQIVNTMPENTLNAVKANGVFFGDSITPNIGKAKQIMAKLALAGIDLDKITNELELDGVEKFEKAWIELMNSENKIVTGEQ